MAGGKSLVANRKKDFLGVTDLNLDLGDWGFSALVIPNVRRQTCFRATDGFSTVARTFRRCVLRYPSNYPTKTFSHLDQYLCMAFAQLTFRESLRDIEVCLRAHESKLYHLGIRGHVARSNLADANEKRDWQIYRDLANALIVEARRLYAGDAFAVDLENTVYALDTTTIDLSLKVFPWAHFRTTKAAVKMHTQIDLRGNIPSFIHVSDGKMHEVNVLDLIMPEPGSFTIMDRGFLDFARIYRLTQADR